MDYYLDYTRAFGRFTASIGYADYTYPNTAYISTGELYLKGGTDLKIVAPSVEFYWDTKQSHGVYLSPKLKRAFPLASIPGLTPSVTVSIGYGDKKHNLLWYATEKAGLTDFTGTMNLVYSFPGNLGRYLAVNGELGYARLLTKELADPFAENGPYSMDGKDHRGNFWFGLGLNAFFPINFGGGK
jgi:hypothetical protein